MTSRAVTLACAAAVVLAACGSGSSGTADPAPTTRPAGATADTAGAPADTTPVTDPAATDTSTTVAPPPFDGNFPPPVTLVDGLAYDVCEAVPVDALPADAGEADGSGLDELANRGLPEGVVGCRWSGPDYTTALEVWVWTDDAVRFALDDPTATAATQAQAWKDIQRMGVAESGFPTTSLPVEQGWLDADVDSYDVLSYGLIGDGVVVAVHASTTGDGCFGTEEEIVQCQTGALTAFQPTAAAIAASVQDTLTSGTGEPAEWPAALTNLESVSIQSSGGPIDPCLVSADVLTEAYGHPYTVRISYVSDDGNSGAGPLAECMLVPLDRDRFPEVDMRFADSSTANVDAMVAAGREYADMSGAPVPGAEESFVVPGGEMWIKVGDVWVRSITFFNGSSRDDPQVVAALTALAAQL